jgi:lysophospholipase L1-like esterase
MKSMKRMMWPLLVVLAVSLGTAPAFASDSPASAADDSSQVVIAADATRYMALGDSIAAGYLAVPVTKGYVYRLYEKAAFDSIDHTLFCNAAVPGASSADVLLHQVPQALIRSADGGFVPKYVTLTVGGNDLLSILHYIQSNPDPSTVVPFATQVITQYGRNLGAILFQLRTGLPNAQVFVANQYALPDVEALVPLAAPMIAFFNDVINQVVGQFPTNVHVVDVHTAFLGRRNLLLADLAGVSPLETHPSNKGYRAMAEAFAAVIDQHRQ